MIALVCTVILTFVGVVGIIVAICTLSKIGDQAQKTAEAAKATRDSVEAIKKQSEIMVNAERAWIDGAFVKHENVGVVRYLFAVTNHGKTPARMLGYDVYHGPLDEGADFSNETLSNHFFKEAHLLVGGGETKKITENFNMDDIFANPNVQMRGAFRVIIRYRDIVGADPQPHETMLHYIYNLLLSHLTPVYEHDKYT